MRDTFFSGAASSRYVSASVRWRMGNRRTSGLRPARDHYDAAGTIRILIIDLQFLIGPRVGIKRT